ncbi:MAG: PDZ domain-containing protein, partial [Lautropia sp.]|nr:PDZ domain-containing protein [Lautropia sp.]
APVDRYLFMTMAVGDGYGGLEHRASTALICSRKDLPWPGMQGTPEGYQTFLGLASHEYFHTWHVKRIKPACFDPYDLDRESFTALLWVFEGFTSYYDDLMLVRSGVIDQGAYLKLLEQNIRRVADNPGRHLQSIAESSQDAWTKYYRQDENSNNSISSYYVKGGLVALCLDLTIRAKTGSKHSLDDVMRLMWTRYGRDFYPVSGTGRGVKEDEMPALIKAATGIDLSRQIKAWAYGTAELPLAACLKPFGLSLRQDKGSSQPDGAWFGARTAVRDGELTIVSTQRGGPASNAGLSAGDKLVAIDGLRCTEAGLKTLLARRRSGDEIEVVGFRRDELFQLTVRLGQPPGQMALDLVEDANPARDAWLGKAGKRKRSPRSTE